MSLRIRSVATRALILILAGSVLSGAARAASTVITGWNFQNTSATTTATFVTGSTLAAGLPVPSNVSPDLGAVLTGTAYSLGMNNSYTTSGVTGAIDGSNVFDDTDLGTSDPSSPNYAWKIVGVGGSTPATKGNGWSSQAPIGTQGAEFLVNTSGYAGISLQFDWEATTQGEANLQVQYTLNGGTTWTNIAATSVGTVTSNTAGSTPAPTATILTNSSSSNTVTGSYIHGSATKGAYFADIVVNFSAITGANNNPNFGVRLVNASTGADCVAQAGTALNNTSGNWRFDYVLVSGTPLAFTAGNLILSRSTYSLVGQAASLQVGSNLPDSADGVTPFVAIASGAYPAVFNNDTVDANFGVTAPVYLDELSTSGALIATVPVPTSTMVTSFPSKSELGLSLSSDGQYLTFMGYAAAPGALDISNSNTPGIIEPGNYITAAPTYREVVQVDPYGTITATTTNAYPGNNGRNAILANGVYYTVGNAGAGNGSAAVSAATGSQIVIPGQNATSATPGTIQVGTYSITENGYSADKVAKDNNFRGQTIFNNTLYVSKGSGGSGIDTVYQVGTAGSLPTLGQAGSVPITVLPGFPTNLAASGTGLSHPFGLWFANATTLYVADEGDGIVADLTNGNDPNSGLQKWIYSGGTWSLAYTLQNGLNLGVTYTIGDGQGNFYYPTQTDGLRHLTGTVNSNGTVTIYATTSTTSTSGDPGADPNALVVITDTLANTTAAGASSESFTTLRTAAYGQVFRGISFAPVPAAVAAPSISSQPSSATVYSGSSTTFTVTATGNPAPTYQWYFNSGPISGATSSSYSISSVTSANQGLYYVIVSNSQGSVTSSTVSLTVNAPVPPTISVQPVSQTVTEGSYTTLSVTASSAPSPTYQWYLGGTAISGATSATYSFTALPSAAGAYTVAVSNTITTVTSSTANVVVNTPNLGTVIAGWDFQNLAIATDLTPTADLGTPSAGAASTLGMTNSYPTPDASTDISDVEGGAGTDVGSSDPVGYNNQAWRVRGGPAITGQTANGWSSLAPIGTQGAQFLVNTTGYNTIKLRFDVETTSKAEGNLEVLYTLDGSTWTNIPVTVTTTPATGNTATVTTNSTSPNTVSGSYVNFAGAGAWFNGIVADFSSISGAANNPNFGVRLVNASTGADCVNQSGGAYNNSSGNWRFDEVQVLGAPIPAAPSFTSQPPSSTPVSSGGSVTLTGTATGTPAPTFQWYYNGVAIPGATTSSYTVSSANVGTYTLTATNSQGSSSITFDVVLSVDSSDTPAMPLWALVSLGAVLVLVGARFLPSAGRERA